MRRGSVDLNFLSCGPNIMPARFKRKNIDETQPTVHAAISAFETLAGPAYSWARQKAFYATHRRALAPAS